MSRGKRDTRERLGRARPRTGLGDRASARAAAHHRRAARGAPRPRPARALRPHPAHALRRGHPRRRPSWPTAPLSSSPGTCTTTRRSASWSAWWNAFQARTSWKPWKSSIAGWTLLRPMPPSGSGRPSPRHFPRGTRPRHRLLRRRQLAAAPNRPRAVPGRDRLRGLQRGPAGRVRAHRTRHRGRHGRAGAKGEGGRRPFHKSSTSRLTPTQRHSFNWPL